MTAQEKERKVEITGGPGWIGLMLTIIAIALWSIAIDLSKIVKALAG